MFTENQLEHFSDEILNNYYEQISREINTRKSNRRIEEIKRIVDEKKIYISTECLDFDDEEYRVIKRKFIFTAVSSAGRLDDAEDYFIFGELASPKDHLFDNTHEVFAPTKDEYSFYKDHVPTGKSLTEWHDKHKYGSKEDNEYLSNMCSNCVDWDEEFCEGGHNFGALYNIELFVYYKIPDDDEGLVYNVDIDKYEYYKLTDEHLEIYEEVKGSDKSDITVDGAHPRHFVFEYTESDGSYLENRIAV